MITCNTKRYCNNAYECDLVAHDIIEGKPKAYLYERAKQQYLAGSRQEPALAEDAFIEMAVKGSNHMTFTCEVPGAGHQLALDKNMDGTYNRDEES